MACTSFVRLSDWNDASDFGKGCVSRVFSTGKPAGAIVKTINLNAAALRPVSTWSTGGNLVYFGSYNSNAVAYRVLSSPNTQASSENYLLLDCNTILKAMRFSDLNTNVSKKIKVTKKSVTLKMGKTTKIKAPIVKQSSKKKLLGRWHGASLRYYSTDTGVATVTSKGKIKAKGKGTCDIYVTALNGVKTRVKVTVK